MSKRTSRNYKGEKSPESSDGEYERRQDISRNELLNPDPALFRTLDRPSGRRSTIDDDVQSDFVNLSISRQGSRFDLSKLSKEERLQLKKELEDVGTDNKTLKNRADEQSEDGEETEETERESNASSEEEEEEEEMREDEQQEVLTDSLSKAERTEIDREMPFLARVPNDKIPEVLLIMRNLHMSIENKSKNMEDYLTPQALTECELYLENQRCDFLKYAPRPGDRRLAEKAGAKERYDDLAAIVENWGDDAKKSFGFWIEKLKASQAPVEEPVKECPKGNKITPKKEKLPEKDKKKDSDSPRKEKRKEKKDEASPDTTTKKSTPKKEKADEKKKSPKQKAKEFAQKIPGMSPKPSKMAEGPVYSDIEGISFNQETFDKCPQTMNIVLMGGTGVGKSSFINNLVNLLSFKDLDDAEKNKFHVLIPASFTHITPDFKKVQVIAKPNVRVERLGDAEEHNEVDRPGASATQAPKSYLFSWGPQENRKFIRLIDTPGVGDTRGTNVDNENFARILDFIAGFKEIHAICILMKANEARSGVIFRYCHNQLFGHLHQSATKNIFFCFTNTRGADYSPGDSYRTLSGELEKLDHKIDVDGKYFCFDSESFRYLCSRRNGIEFEPDATNGYRNSFDRSKKQIFRLIKAITEVDPHLVGQTLDVNNVRRLIMALLRPVAELSKSIMVTARMLEEKIQELEEIKKRGDDVQSNMNIRVPKLTVKNLPYPVTVCASPSCTERKTINGVDQIHYKTECHSHCHLHGVQTSILNNPALQNCVALAGHIRKCSNCSCSWEMHMHITYTLENEWGDAIDSTKLDELKNIADKKKQAEELILYYKQRIAEFNTEKAKILTFLADALAFLKQHSIVPVNDAFVEYLGHMIKQEEAKVQRGGDETLLKELNDYRDQYKELVRQQEQTTVYRVKSTEEMYELIQKLKNMAQNGAIFKEVQKLDVLQLKNLPDGDAKTVDLNIGWLGYIFYKMSQIKKKLIG